MSKALFDTNSIANANLLETVPVVPDAIVSKPLVQSASCKMIVFAMDAGQSISEHHAPYVATVQVLDGRLEFGAGGQTYSMAANDWLILPYDAKHDLVATEPTRFLLTLLRQ
jgi:quercetin dioxygenase-like cupin family protein